MRNFHHPKKNTKVPSTPPEKTKKIFKAPKLRKNRKLFRLKLNISRISEHHFRNFLHRNPEVVIEGKKILKADDDYFLEKSKLDSAKKCFADDTNMRDTKKGEEDVFNNKLQKVVCQKQQDNFLFSTIQRKKFSLNLNRLDFPGDFLKNGIVKYIGGKFGGSLFKNDDPQNFKIEGRPVPNFGQDPQNENNRIYTKRSQFLSYNPFGNLKDFFS